MILSDNNRQGHILLKKLGLDLIPPNYRPVSNLLFFSKLLEKCILLQINDHCAKYDLMPECQSAYCTNYSTATSLFELTNNLLWGMECQDVMALTALDISAAFDTVDHQILLDILKAQFGINNYVLNWFKTCLAPRKFIVSPKKKICSFQSHREVL